jgi:hypothetical protein
VFRVPGHPVTPAIFLGLVLMAWVHGLRQRPVPTGAALLTIAGGVVAFVAARALGWFKDPAGGRT